MATKKRPPASPLSVKPRKLKPVKGRMFGIVKKQKYRVAYPSSWSIFKSSLKHIWKYKKLFGGILLVYLALTVVLVRGFGVNTDLGTAREAFSEMFSGSLKGVGSMLGVMAVLVTNNSPNNQMAGMYQSIIYVVVSLTIIWALRQTYAREKVTVKDCFYKSTTPLVPFILVLAFMGLQLLPVIITSFIYSFMISAEIANNLPEKILVTVPLLASMLWSIYMISSSIFALYIVTLPNKTPLESLRRAKRLVRYHRWTIIRKVVYLPFIMILFLMLVMLPVILLIPIIAEVVFLLVILLMSIIGNAYMYTLYRELVKQ